MPADWASPNDDKKAAEWYKLAAARGDREAMFALAMFKMTGRGGPADRPEAARLLAEAAKLGHVVAVYDLALLYLEGQIVPQDFVRAAELMRRAADAGNPEAQYALATFYKEGRGVAEEPGGGRAPARPRGALGPYRCRGRIRHRAVQRHRRRQERSAAAGFFLKAAQKSNPVAQNRLAWMYATGRGIKADPVEAGRWHLIAQAGGDNDQYLEDFMRNMKPTDRAMAENKAKPWIARMNPVGPTPFPDGAAHRPSRSRSSLDGCSGVGASARLQPDRDHKHDGPVMAKISGSDIRPGMVIEHDGSLWAAVKTGAVKPGKGPAYNQVELKNILDGRKLNQRFGGSDRVEETEVERRQFQFLYKQGEQLVFMDTASYDQIELGEDFVGERADLPAGRHDGAGATARRPADRHQAAGDRGARSGRGRRPHQGPDRRVVLQAGQARERPSRPGAALHFHRREDRGLDRRSRLRASGRS